MKMFTEHLLLTFFSLSLVDFYQCPSELGQGIAFKNQKKLENDHSTYKKVLISF